MNIQIITDKRSWLDVSYKAKIINTLKHFSKKIFFTYDFKNLKDKYDINIILSYSRIIPVKNLKKSKFNLVVHESNLPNGKGMSPLVWQILANKKFVYFSLLNASPQIDNGEIYYKKKINFSKDLIFSEIKEIQFKEGLELIIKFIKFYKKNQKAPKAYSQIGKSTFFKLRNKNDSELNINQSIKKQFNLMRVNDNKNYPSFFNYMGKKYIINLYKQKKRN